MILVAAAAVAVIGLVYLNSHLGFGRFPGLIGFGVATFIRVVVLLVISTIIWVPVGVKIGMSPKLSRFAQPVVQVLASFPAILLFPFATLIFIDLGISLDYGAILLMMLGAQWYILFNVIAGASSIPNDLREMMVTMRLTRRQRWRQVILPAIFPAYVTGGITAAGGAWNASIVAELVSWHHHTLDAYGLGELHRHSFHSGQVRPPHCRGHRHECLRGGGEPAVLAAALCAWPRAGSLCDHRDIDRGPVVGKGWSLVTTTSLQATRTDADPKTIIEVSHVTKTFVSPDGSPLPGARRHLARPARRGDRGAARTLRARARAPSCVASPD